MTPRAPPPSPLGQQHCRVSSMSRPMEVDAELVVVLLPGVFPPLSLSLPSSNSSPSSSPPPLSYAPSHLLGRPIALRP